MFLLQHGAVRKKVNQAMQYSLLLNRIAEILCTNDLCFPISCSAGMPHLQGQRWGKCNKSQSLPHSPGKLLFGVVHQCACNLLK